MRNLSKLDRLICEVDAGLRACSGVNQSRRPNPAYAHASQTLTDAERKSVAALIRVDHAGEVCAGALYRGQALTAKHAKTQADLLQAAEEEQAHLAWCEQRLKQLGDRPSYLNPFWYLGSWGLGAVTGMFGDRWSLGFVIETERQVEAHLADHLKRLPETDLASAAMLTTMQEDEAQHAQHAEASGGQPLPPVVSGLMRACAKIMTTIAAKI